MIASYTTVRCPACNKRLLDVPGKPAIEFRQPKDDASRSGEGRVLGCGRCGNLVEIVER